MSGANVGALSIGLWLVSWELASRYELELFFRFENIPAPTEVAVAPGLAASAAALAAAAVPSDMRLKRCVFIYLASDLAAAGMATVKVPTLTG